MIAIAIIGILALVLIPKVGGMKSQAKLAGIDTNLRIAMSAIEGIINDYDADAAGAAALRTNITTRLATNNTAKDIKNPITGFTGVVGATPVNGNAAFAYAATDSTTAEITAPADNANMKGVIYFQTWANASTGELNVTLFAYDDNGNYMAGKKKVVTK